MTRCFSFVGPKIWFVGMCFTGGRTLDSEVLAVSEIGTHWRLFDPQHSETRDSVISFVGIYVFPFQMFD